MADTNTAGASSQAESNRITNTDELDHYISVTSPSAWVVLLAALLLIGGLVIWALVAVIPVTVNTTGFVKDNGKVFCWVDEPTAQKIRDLGAVATIGSTPAKSVTVDAMPMSATEVRSILGSDFYAESIDFKEWNYLVVLEPGGEVQTSDFTISSLIGDTYLVQVSIVVSETRPINIVMNQG